MTYNIYAEAYQEEEKQDFMASMTTMGLSQAISGHNQQAGDI